MAVARNPYPFLIACGIALVGAFFLLCALVETPILRAEPPGRYYLAGVAVAFTLAGLYFMLMARRGDLKKRGKSIVKIRVEAAERLKDPVLLEKMSRDEEEAPEVREQAMKRLAELSGKDVSELMGYDAVEPSDKDTVEPAGNDAEEIAGASEAPPEKR